MYYSVAQGFSEVSGFMVEKDLKCIACGSDVTVELQGLFDTRFGIEKVWNICRCIDCGMEQTLPVPSPGELKKLYEDITILVARKERAIRAFANDF